jgi:hypothetical protein
MNITGDVPLPASRMPRNSRENAISVPDSAVRVAFRQQRNQLLVKPLFSQEDFNKCLTTQTPWRRVQHVKRCRTRHNGGAVVVQTLPRGPDGSRRKIRRGPGLGSPRVCPGTLPGTILRVVRSTRDDEL